MGWVSRRDWVGGHECKLPELYGFVGLGWPRAPQASAGDVWQCRKCRRLWRVEEIIVVPPGYRGSRENLHSTKIQWSDF